MPQQRTRRCLFDQANFISKITFWWLNPVFGKSASHVAEVSAQYEVPASDEADLLERRLDRCWKQEVGKYSEGCEANLLRAILSAFLLRWILPGLVLLVAETARVMQPVLLGWLLAHLSGHSHLTTEDAHLYGFGLACMLCVHAIFCVLYTFLMRRVALSMKTSLEALMYRKVISLSSEAAQQTSPVTITQQLAIETRVFSGAIEHLHYLWVGPLQVCVVGYLVWNEVGDAGLLCLAIIVAVVCLQAMLELGATKLRQRSEAWKEQRRQMTSNILAAMLQVKVTCLETVMTPLITALRRNEIPWLRGSTVLQGISCCLLGASCRLMLLLIVCVVTDMPLTLQPLFTTFALLDVLMWCASHFPLPGVRDLLTLRAALHAVQTFLLLDEEKEQIKDLRLHRTVSYRNEPYADWVVDIDHMTARWRTVHTGERKRFMKRRTRDSTSSTKSLLHESDAEHAFSLKYLSLQVKKGELLAVIGMPNSGKTSLLMTLIGELPYEIGQISVNGRVSFCPQSPWLFSASVRENILFGDTFDATRYDAAVHACSLNTLLHMLPEGDATQIGDRGLELSPSYAAMVTLARAVYNNADIYLLDDILASVDNATRQDIFKGCVGGMLRGKTRIVVTHHLHWLRSSDRIAVLREGALSDIGSLEELQARGVNLREYVHADQAHTGTQVDAEEEHFHVRLQLMRQVTEGGQKETDAARSDLATCFTFMTSSRMWIALPLLAILWLGTQSLASAADWMLACWVQQNNRVEQNNSDLHVGSDVAPPPLFDLYVTLTSSAVGVALLCVVMASLVCVGASQALHSKMVNSVMRAQASFFLLTPVDQVVSSLVQHLQFIDTCLPHLAIISTQIALSALGMVVVVCVVSPWLVLAAVFLLVVMTALQLIAGRTLQGIRRYREAARTPVYTDIRETLGGLQMIHAFRRQDHFLQVFDCNLNSLTWARFLSLCTYSRLALICGFLITVYTSVLIYVTVALAGELSSGLLGLVLTYCVTIVLPLQDLLQHSVALGNQMGLVEHAVTLAGQQEEGSWFSDKPPPSDWPNRGSITFSKASLMAGPQGPCILRNIDVHVKSKEKVGVLGEAGGGKYSLAAMLTRLQPVQGLIFIDGYNVVNIGLHELRKNIAIVPQDPVFFPGTLRDNLDPGQMCKDEQLWAALERVGLRDKVSGVRGGLSADTSSEHVNLSLGQRQLVCLARALLRKIKIIVFEESVETSEHGLTDHIQRILRAKFRDCTVLMVAHRLTSVMDCDRIMVFVDGQIREFDTPYALLQQESGHFARLVEQSGRRQAQQLRSMAELSHLQRASASLMLEHAVFMATEQLHASTDDLTFRPGSLAWSHMAKLTQSQDSLEKTHSDWGSRGDVREEADAPPVPRHKPIPSLAPAQKIINKRRMSPNRGKRQPGDRGEEGKPRESEGRREREGEEGTEQIPLLSYDAPPKSVAQPRGGQTEGGTTDSAASPLLDLNSSPHHHPTPPPPKPHTHSPTHTHTPTHPRSPPRGGDVTEGQVVGRRAFETPIDTPPAPHRKFSPFPADTDTGSSTRAVNQVLTSVRGDNQTVRAVNYAPSSRVVYRRDQQARIISGEYTPPAERDKDNSEKIYMV